MPARHDTSLVWHRSGSLGLAVMIGVLAACSSRPQPDGKTGIDFSIQLDQPGIESLVSKQGSRPLSGSEQAALVAGWLVIGVLYEMAGAHIEGPTLPTSTEVRVRLVDEHQTVVATRALAWGTNEWHQPLWPGTFTVVVDVTGNRGSARLSSPPLPVASGERMAVEFELRPPDSVAPPTP
jgi:hypothetical protein